jgi:hypothetical protein
MVTVARQDDDTVVVTTYDTGTEADELLTDYPFEIHVYPEPV